MIPTRATVQNTNRGPPVSDRGQGTTTRVVVLPDRLAASTRTLTSGPTARDAISGSYKNPMEMKLSPLLLQLFPYIEVSCHRPSPPVSHRLR
jgi:hypothetical protein